MLATISAFFPELSFNLKDASGITLIISLASIFPFTETV